MPEDPRAGALLRAADPIENAIAATAGDETELDRYAVLELFAAAGVPEPAARAFLWPRLPGAATVTEAEARALLEECTAVRPRAAEAVG